jgi:flagellar biogenesis protein FliO
MRHPHPRAGGEQGPVKARQLGIGCLLLLGLVSPAAASPIAVGPAASPGSLSPRSPSPTALLSLAGLAALGAWAWWRRRREAPEVNVSTLEIVSQTSLGGRVRAVWLRAGDRQMVITVTPHAVQILDRWPSSPPLLDDALSAAQGKAQVGDEFTRSGAPARSPGWPSADLARSSRGRPCLGSSGRPRNRNDPG